MKKAIVVTLLALAGCSSTPPAPEPAPAHQPASAAAPVPQQVGVQVLTNYPTAAYENLGIVDYSFFRPGLRTPSLADVLPDLKSKVQDFGGNAFIVRHRVPDRDDKRTLRVTVEVLKLK
jgi:hypothetical protein